MVAQLLFSGRVAVITGAGGGLGKAYALELARRGASVVVNDLGGGRHGDGKGSELADLVVKEIKDGGGVAVANYDSVEDGEKIIETAISNFGRVDIVINNAGILRDRSFLNLTHDDVDKILQVHFKGSFNVTKAAWPHMRKQNFGRVIMTSSASGLYGNFGQANYSAAKMALIGLASTLKLEGAKYNINVNTIAPLAKTRLTEDSPIDVCLPEHVAPFVVYLCHENCQDTGVIVEAGGGVACKVRLQRSSLVKLRDYVDEEVTAERVFESWDQLEDYSNASYPTNVQESTIGMQQLLGDLIEGSGQIELSADEKAKAFKFEEMRCDYTDNDSMLYALSIGASIPDDMQYLYEDHQNFSVIPTFIAPLSLNGLFGQFGAVDGMEGVDVTRAVHGEQYIELLKPLPTSGILNFKGRVVDLLNKKKFTQLIVNVDVFDGKDEHVAKTQMVALFLGSAVGRVGRSDEQVPTGQPPNRPPDAVVEEQTSTNQAALYRLNGDRNPLHIDPQISPILGFSKPILHGLCTYGYSCRHILKQYGNNDSSNFKAMKAQFSKPVIPGQTLLTEMWLEGSRVFYQTKVKETGVVVMKGGYVDLKSVTNAVRPKPSEAPVVDPVSEDTSVPQLKATAIIAEMKAKIDANPGAIKKIKGTFGFQITKNDKIACEWLMDFNQSPPSVQENPSDSKADVTLKMDDDVFEALATGKLNSMQAFMQGKIKLKGQIMKAQVLGELFKQHSKL